MTVSQLIVCKVFTICAFFMIAERSVASVETIRECMEKAGQKYDLDPNLLYSIAVVESSLNPNAVRKGESDEDVGLMQINSFWYPKLEGYGIKRSDLFEPCLSAHVGAWILRHSIDFFGENWRAVGAYNAGTARNEHREKLRQKYANRVYRVYRNISNGM